MASQGDSEPRRKLPGDNGNSSTPSNVKESREIGRKDWPRPCCACLYHAVLNNRLPLCTRAKPRCTIHHQSRSIRLQIGLCWYLRWTPHLTIGTITKFPLFKAPHGGEHPLSTSEKTILFLGDRRDPTASPTTIGRTDLDPLVVRYAFTVALCFYVLLIEGRLSLVETLKMIWEDFNLPFKQKRRLSEIDYLVLFLTAIFGFMLGVALAADINIPHRLRRHRLAAGCCSDLAYLAILPFTIGPMFGFLLQCSKMYCHCTC